MSDENKIRDAVDAVKGIVEAVPVYQDVAQPAAKELGLALQTVAKTIRVALAPLSALVWGYEKIADFLDEKLTEKLKDVPPERIVTPNPTIAGPTIEALRFAAHESSLPELYANLLATAMDESTIQNAHPAFVDIIRHMAPDEARLVQLFSTNRIFPLITLRATFPDEPGLVVFDEHFSTLGEDAKCEHPEMILSYLDNLRRLGLVEFSAKSYYEPAHGEMLKLESHPRVQKFIADYKDDPNSTLEIIRESISVTNLGRQFCRACVNRPVSN